MSERRAIPEDIVEYIEFREDGLPYWIKTRAPNAKAGTVAGTVQADGRRRIRFRGPKYYASRVHWFLETGEQPAAEIDHKSRDPGNDQIGNLRVATSSENLANRVWAKPSPYGRGVKKQSSGRYRAQIDVGGKKRHLGTYDEAWQAQLMRDRAALKHFGEFAILNTEIN